MLLFAVSFFFPWLDSDRQFGVSLGAFRYLTGMALVTAFADGICTFFSLGCLARDEWRRVSPRRV